MRRKDREITDEKRIDEIILACDCCRLGFRDGDGCYILPLNFGFVNENGRRTFYFHSATEGKKIALISTGPTVSFELDGVHGLNAGNVACAYSYRFQSVMGKGLVRFVKEKNEKSNALATIMKYYAQKECWAFPDAALDGVAVYRLDVSEISGKEHL